MQRVHFQVWVGAFNCQQIFFRYLWYCRLVWHWWHSTDWGLIDIFFYRSECRNCCLYIIIQKITPQAESGKYFQIWFFPRFGGKMAAHASYPGLSFHPPGFSPYMGREERRVQGLDYKPHWSNCNLKKIYSQCYDVVCQFPLREERVKQDISNKDIIYTVQFVLSKWKSPNPNELSWLLKQCGNFSRYHFFEAKHMCW